MLSSLKSLTIYNNEIGGKIPPELGDLSQLESLEAQNNRFEGEIPPELGQLNNLGFIRFDDNQLSGEIPLELGNLTNLWFFSFRNNQLNGAIPPELGNLDPSLFALSENNLEGCFPEELRENLCPTASFENNPLLPWQGDFTHFCNRELQIGANCDDGDPNTQNDVIQSDCTCGGTLVSASSQIIDNSLIISPNPTNGKVVFSGLKATKILAFNQLGQLAKIRFYQENQILEFLNSPKGTYFLKIRTDSEIFVKKVLLK